MQVVDRNQMAETQAAGGTGGGVSLPLPSSQTQIQSHDEMAQKYQKWGIVPLEPSRYLREKVGGTVHAWSENMGKRSDLVEPYTPTLQELIRFGEEFC